jgi:hypothetical protein
LVACRTASSAGPLTVTGAYTQTSTGALNIKLGGPNPGTDFDQLAVSGAAALDGTLNVTLIPGFTPNAGNNFQILPCASSSNDFATKTGFQLGGGLFLREDLTSGVTLQAFQAQLLFQQQPTDTTAGQFITPAVQVAIVDPSTGIPIAFDNSDMVTLSLNDNPMTGATLSGTLTVTVVNGVATFSDLSIDLAGIGYTLHASIGGGLPDIDSNPFNIT